MAKTIKTKVNSANIWSEIDLVSDVSASRDTKDKIKNEVGEFLVEQTLLAVGQAKSPVDGADYKASLSKEYKKDKQEAGRPGIANLEFDGDMLDSLTFELTSKGVRIGHIDTPEAKKSDGHNNFSGESTLPERRYLPNEGESYKSSIEREINKIITDNVAKDNASKLNRSTLSGVTTKSGFWELMLDTFPEFSRAQVRGAVARDASLFSLLSEFGLLRFLNPNG